MKMSKLSKEQKKYAPAIRWLLNGSCGSGRSYLMAWIFLEMAIKNLGKPIKIFDHSFLYTYEHTIDYLLQTIRQLCPREYMITYKLLNKTIEVNKK